MAARTAASPCAESAAASPTRAAHSRRAMESAASRQQAAPCVSETAEAEPAVGASRAPEGEPGGVTRRSGREGEEHRAADEAAARRSCMGDGAPIHGDVVCPQRRGTEARLLARAHELELPVRLALARRHPLPVRRRVVEQRDGARRRLVVVGTQAQMPHERLERGALAAQAGIGDGVIGAVLLGDVSPCIASATFTVAMLPSLPPSPSVNRYGHGRVAV